jgi:hypothetical protein
MTPKKALKRADGEWLSGTSAHAVCPLATHLMIELSLPKTGRLKNHSTNSIRIWNIVAPKIRVASGLGGYQKLLFDRGM